MNPSSKAYFFDFFCGIERFKTLSSANVMIEIVLYKLVVRRPKFGLLVANFAFILSEDTCT